MPCFRTRYEWHRATRRGTDREARADTENKSKPDQSIVSIAFHSQADGR